jgi:hypothetical protein
MNRGAAFLFEIQRDHGELQLTATSRASLISSIATQIPFGAAQLWVEVPACPGKPAQSSSLSPIEQIRRETKRSANDDRFTRRSRVSIREPARPDDAGYITAPRFQRTFESIIAEYQVGYRGRRVQ